MVDLKPVRYATVQEKPEVLWCSNLSRSLDAGNNIARSDPQPIPRSGGAEEGEVAPGTGEEEKTIPPAAYMRLGLQYFSGLGSGDVRRSIRKRCWLEFVSR